jgi:hypothetical protein
MKAQRRSESINNRTVFLTSALDEGKWSTPLLGRFTPGKETGYPLYRRLGGSQGRSGRVRKISPLPGFDPRTSEECKIMNTLLCCCFKFQETFDFQPNTYLIFTPSFCRNSASMIWFWFQLAKFRHLSSADVDMENNFRPVQPTNGRPVYYVS